MADHADGDKSPSPIDQGIKLLREATELLSAAAGGNATTTCTDNRAERITSNLRTLDCEKDGRWTGLSLILTLVDPISYTFLIYNLEKHVYYMESWRSIKTAQGKRALQISRRS